MAIKKKKSSAKSKCAATLKIPQVREKAEPFRIPKNYEMRHGATTLGKSITSLLEKTRAYFRPGEKAEA